MNVKIITYPWTQNCTVYLNGRDLAAVDRNLARSGIKDQSGKRFYAVTSSTITLNLTPLARLLRKHVYLKTKLGKPERNVRLTYGFKDVILSVTSHTEFCLPKKLDSFCPAAKAEWKRFFQKTMKHEKRHHTDAMDIARHFKAVIENAQVTVKRKHFDPYSMSDLEEAEKQAAKSAEAHVKGLEPALKGNISMAIKVRDKITLHGKRFGAKLNTKIACR